MATHDTLKNSSPHVRKHESECCSTDHGQAHSHDGHHHGGEGKLHPWWKTYSPAIITFVMLMLGIVMDHYAAKGNNFTFFQGYLRLAYYLVAYTIIGRGVLWAAIRSIRRGDVFSEFFLMSIATFGAFYIGEYPEGIAVMLFYQIGELFQDAAVQNAQKSIKALLDIRPDQVTVLRNSTPQTVRPAEVNINEIIRIKPGEKAALDGVLLSEKAAFNTAALTGESKPDNKYKGEPVLAGMINLNTLAEVQVTASFKDSKLSRILQLVQDATARKAKTQLFISRFAKTYTPVVVFLALGVALLPYFFVEQYIFNDWLYRALVFLVISCPCALVVSIPLGYFGGIGLASRNGILFKGSSYLDVITEINTVVMDKTGTLTKGVFKVQQAEPFEIEKDLFLQLTAAMEASSTHPIAKAVVDYANKLAPLKAGSVEEIPGHGLKGKVDGREILVGNLKLLSKFNITYDQKVEAITDTIVVTAVDGKYAGFITIADEMKEDALETIKALHSLNIKTVMLSGDKQSVVNEAAKFLHIDEAYGDLLPEGKVDKVQALKDQGRKIAFAGDGVNDAPVVALADAGIAMGGLGSDATIETADIVIQNDQPYKIYTAIKIGKITKQIVWQNIGLAFGVKLIVLILGAGGLANLWEAVFADVGVALLAILNAVRIQRMKV